MTTLTTPPSRDNCVFSRPWIPLLMEIQWCEEINRLFLIRIHAAHLVHLVLQAVLMQENEYHISFKGNKIHMITSSKSFLVTGFYGNHISIGYILSILKNILSKCINQYR